ncbi:MAG TPA: hypothetical protein VMT28_12185 [Terriglobales bacterium]|jgi:hypothetical protein|nr:hypothetical protein [Terriglobales bacterium]
MKHLIARTLTSLSLAVLLLAGMAHAQYASVIKLKVPFEFVVGGQTFPAGEYSLVRTAPYLLVLRDAQAHSLMNVITRSTEAASAPTSPRVRFYTDGERHVLAQVWQQGDSIGQELYRPKAETVIARHRTVHTEAEDVIVGSQP